MKETWERSIPVYKVNYENISKMVKEYNKAIEVYSFSLIDNGSRNSNYRVYTSKGTLFFRICPYIKHDYHNEMIINKILYNKIKIPKLLYRGNINGIYFMIYEFIFGNRLRPCDINNETIENIAKTLSQIHNTEEYVKTKFTPLKVPDCYSLFLILLENPILKSRIDKNTIEKIYKLIIAHKSDIDIIEKYKAIIHGDFRLGNMIRALDNNIYYTDFEFASYGYIFSDIGELFRYDEDFNELQKDLFYKVYNENSQRYKLPTNWYELSKIADLLDYVQMFCEKSYLLSKQNDLLSLTYQCLEKLTIS